MTISWTHGAHWTPDLAMELARLLNAKGGFCGEVLKLMEGASLGFSSEMLSPMANLAYLAAEPMIRRSWDPATFKGIENLIREILSEAIMPSEQGRSRS